MRRYPLYLVGLLTAAALLLSITPEFTPEKYLGLTLGVGLITLVMALIARQSAAGGFLLKVGVGAGLITATSAGMRWLLTRVVEWYDRFSRYAESPETEGGFTRILVCAIIITLIVLVWKAGLEQVVKPELARLTTFLVMRSQPQVAVSQPRPAASPITPVHVPLAVVSQPQPPAKPTTSTPQRLPAQHALPATSGRTDQEDMLAMLLAMETAKVTAAFQGSARKPNNCSACGHALPKDGAFYCSHCGASVLGMKPVDTCDSCGAQIQDPQTQKFCYICGHPRQLALPTHPQVSLPVYTPPTT